MTRFDQVLLACGVFLFLFGVFLSVIQKEPHFYTPFSFGLALIFLEIQKFVRKNPLFGNWTMKNYTTFFILLLATSITVDQIGLILGYWAYLSYTTLFDHIIKYVFEWTVPLIYFMSALIIGKEFLNKKLSPELSFICSLTVFITIIGFFTEYINLFSNSWTILKMPFTNYKIGSYFIIFQSLGYWLMAIIPYSIYKMYSQIKRKV